MRWMIATAVLCAAVPAVCQEPPHTWIDPDTGHRIVRLTDEPGSASLYFNQNTHQASDGLTNGWCLDLTITPPVLTITETHTGPGTGNAFVANRRERIPSTSQTPAPALPRARQ